MSEHGLRAGFAVEYLEGDNDWPAVMKALDEIGYHGWGIAEPAWRPQAWNRRRGSNRSRRRWIGSLGCEGAET